MTMKEKEIKRAVKEGYARIAKQATSYYSSQEGSGYFDNLEDICKRIGYSEEDISAAPPESNLGLGCGNPVALAAIKEGERVLDMGSGGGLVPDACCLAFSRSFSGLYLGKPGTSR